jgi:hypothetical protein
MSSPRYLTYNKAEKNKEHASKHAHNGHRITAASLTVRKNTAHCGEIKKHFKEEPVQSPHIHKPKALCFSKGGTRRRRSRSRSGSRSRSRSRKYYRR